MEAKAVWRSVLVRLRDELPAANYDTWLHPTRAISMNDGVLRVTAPSKHGVEWLDERLGGLVRKALSDIGHGDIRVEFFLAETRLDRPDSIVENRAPGFSRPAYGGSFHKKYTFENFVTGAANRFAYGAARAVAERPSISYNPLFIYGGVGLGKTHLLHAIGHQVTANLRDCRVVYTTCENFFNQLIRAIRNGEPDELRDAYRSADVLLLDDIQFITGKESTQEEFFHTFNALHNEGKQIVISSDSPPKALNPLTDRLRSRFEWGLIADIQPPDLETRIAILRSKAELQEFDIPAEVIQYLARRQPDNIRELEGSLNRVVAYAALDGEELSSEIAASALNGINVIKQRRLTPELIIECAAKYFGVTTEDITGKSRDTNRVVPRQVAMYLAREETECSLERIGQVVGGRDHTTVMHAWQKIGKAVQRDLAVRDDVMAIRTLLYAAR